MFKSSESHIELSPPFYTSSPKENTYFSFSFTEDTLSTLEITSKFTSEPPVSTVIMENIKIKNFHGLPSEDPDRFLKDFTSYSTVLNLEGEANDARKVAAFHLHLSGPARTWYNTLEEEDKDTWEHLEVVFNRDFVDIPAANNPALIAEAELFTALRLLPHEQLDEYHSKVVEKGHRLQKTQRDILIKFVEGLPPQLAFFVRAGNPEDHQSALNSAKVGEAYGYRASTPILREETAQGADKLDHLCSQIGSLTDSVRQVLAAKPAAAFETTPRESSRPRGQGQRTTRGPCYKCGRMGHIQRDCRTTTIYCQLCGERGHIAPRCPMLSQQQQASNSPSPATASYNHQGN